MLLPHPPTPFNSWTSPCSLYHSVLAPALPSIFPPTFFMTIAICPINLYSLCCSPQSSLPWGSQPWPFWLCDFSWVISPLFVLTGPYGSQSCYLGCYNYTIYQLYSHIGPKTLQGFIPYSIFTVKGTEQMTKYLMSK